jgi:hypothetical protein
MTMERYVEAVPLSGAFFGQKDSLQMQQDLTVGVGP